MSFALAQHSQGWSAAPAIWSSPYDSISASLIEGAAFCILHDFLEEAQVVHNFGLFLLQAVQLFFR